MSIPNYKESNIAGIKRVRCNQIVMYNSPNGDHRVVFTEEEVLELGNGESVTRPLGNLSVAADTTKTVSYGDTTVSYGQIYQWLALIYLQEAAERDRRNSESWLEMRARELLADYQGTNEYTLEGVIEMLRLNHKLVLR